MDIRKEIQAKKAGEMNALIGNFSNADEVIKKGISQEEFDQRYGSGHEVFTPEALDQFLGDCLEKGESEELIAGELSKLRQVDILVKGEVVTRFVKEIESTEDENEG